MGVLITDTRHVTPDWLTPVLYESQVLDHGHVTSVETIPLALPGISRFARLVLTFSDTVSPLVPSHLFLKLSPPLSDDIRPFLRNKEVEFYQAMRGPVTGLPICRCYDAVSDPETDAYHLVLDDLSLTHSTIPWVHVPPHPRQCAQMVDALAAIHAFWWNHPRLGAGLGERPTPHSEAAFLQWAATTYPRFVDFLAERLSTERRRIFESILAALPRLSQRVTAGGHLTVVHGDAHGANFLFPTDERSSAVRIVDWDWFQISVGPLDLAYQMSLLWFPEHRARFEHGLVRQYHARLLDQGIQAYDWHRCWDDYRFSVIRLLFVPIWRWSVQPWPDSWWPLLEKGLCAYHDLGCAELLEA